MSKLFVLLSIVLILISATLASQAIITPTVNTAESSTYLDFGAGHYYTLVVDNTVPDINYTLTIGQNTLYPYNISFIATEPTSSIQFNWNTTQLDKYNKTLNQLELVFIEAGSYQVFTYWITLKTDNNLSNLTVFGILTIWQALIILVSGFFIVVLVRFVFKHI